MEFFRVFFMDLSIWGSFENGECIWGDINIADKQGRPGTLPLYARVCLVYRLFTSIHPFGAVFLVIF